jgi:hypothetical protein
MQRYALPLCDFLFLFLPDHIPEPFAVIEVTELGRLDGYDVEVDRVRQLIKPLLF